MTESRIFKNLNLRKNANRNFRGNFLQNHFRYLKLQSNPPSWLARSRCHMSTFWETKDCTFLRANLSGFSTWKFPAKEDLNPQKQVFLLNLGAWPAQKPKNLVCFLLEKLYIKKFCSVKIRGFWFKN